MELYNLNEGKMSYIKYYFIYFFLVLGTTLNTYTGQEFIDAVKKNDLDRVKTILETDPTLINFQEKTTSDTALYWAILRLNPEIVEYLLENGFANIQHAFEYVNESDLQYMLGSKFNKDDFDRIEKIMQNVVYLQD
jgi:hypothetical protein